MWHCAVWLTKNNILFPKFCSCQYTIASAFGDTSFTGLCGSTCWKFYLMPWSSTSHHIQSNSLPYAYTEILTPFHPQIMCFLFIPHKHLLVPLQGHHLPLTHLNSYFLPSLPCTCTIHFLFSYLVYPEVHPAGSHKTLYWIPTAWGHPDTVIFMQGTSFLKMSNYILVLAYSGHDWKEVWQHCRFSSCGILYTIHEICYSLYFRVSEVGDWLNSLTALWCMKLTQEMWLPAFREVMSCGLVITSRLQSHIPEETTNFIVTTVRNSNLTWYKSWSNNCVL